MVEQSSSITHYIPLNPQLSLFLFLLPPLLIFPEISGGQVYMLSDTRRLVAYGERSRSLGEEVVLHDPVFPHGKENLAMCADHEHIEKAHDHYKEPASQNLLLALFQSPYSDDIEFLANQIVHL